MDRFELPEQARKVREREAREIARVAEELRSRSFTAEEILSGVCDLLSLRQRYMGSVGEHYSVQRLEGILIVDPLDEQLVREIRGVLKSFVVREDRPPPSKGLARIVDRMPVEFRSLPTYPVAFSILYVLRRAVETYDVLRREGKSGADLDAAMAHYLLGVADRYVQTRDRAVQRHLSDVERETSVVGRLKCSCGEEKYRVTLQSLHTPPEGVPYDHLDLQCDACGARSAVTFDLPHFRDMYQL